MIPKRKVSLPSLEDLEDIPYESDLHEEEDPFSTGYQDDNSDLEREIDEEIGSEVVDFGDIVTHDETYTSEQEYYEEEEPEEGSYEESEQEHPNKDSPLQEVLAKVKNPKVFKKAVLGITILIGILAIGIIAFKLAFSEKKPEEPQQIVQGNQQDITPSNAVIDPDIKLTKLNVNGDVSTGEVMATISFSGDTSGQLYAIYSHDGKISACYSEENDFAGTFEKDVQLSCPRNLGEGYSLIDNYFISGDGREVQK